MPGCVRSETEQTEWMAGDENGRTTFTTRRNCCYERSADHNNDSAKGCLRMYRYLSIIGCTVTLRSAHAAAEIMCMHLVRFQMRPQ